MRSYRQSLRERNRNIVKKSAANKHGALGNADGSAKVKVCGFYSTSSLYTYWVKMITIKRLGSVCAFETFNCEILQVLKKV